MLDHAKFLLGCFRLHFRILLLVLDLMTWLVVLLTELTELDPTDCAMSMHEEIIAISGLYVNLQII